MNLHELINFYIPWKTFGFLMISRVTEFDYFVQIRFT